MTHDEILSLHAAKQENISKIHLEKEIINKRLELANSKKDYYQGVIGRTADPAKKAFRSGVLEIFTKKYLVPLDVRLRRLSERELHEHVMAYSQDKNQEDSLYICEAFKNMIWIYVHIICRQNGFKINRLRDRKFVSLFCPKYIYKFIENNRMSANIRNVLYDGAQFIRYIFRVYNEDEIMDECRIVLLEMATKYRDYTRPSFHTFVDRVYHYKLFSQLLGLIRDPYVRKDHYDFDEYVFAVENSSNLVVQNLLVEDDSVKDFEAADSKIDFYYQTKDRRTVLKEPDIMDLDINWELGNTATGVFRDITATERKILKLKYFNNLSDADIAAQLGMSMSVVSSKRRACVAHITDRYNDMLDAEGLILFEDEDYCDSDEAYYYISNNEGVLSFECD